MPTIIPIHDTIAAIDHDLFGMPGIGVTYVVRGDADGVSATTWSRTAVSHVDAVMPSSS